MLHDKNNTRQEKKDDSTGKHDEKTKKGGAIHDEEWNDGEWNDEEWNSRIE